MTVPVLYRVAGAGTRKNAGWCVFRFCFGVNRRVHVNNVEVKYFRAYSNDADAALVLFGKGADVGDFRSRGKGFFNSDCDATRFVCTSAPPVAPGPGVVFPHNSVPPLLVKSLAGPLYE